jgi:hypothetical protein
MQLRPDPFGDSFVPLTEVHKRTSERFEIPVDHFMGCNHLGHDFDAFGDCRHCPANEDDPTLSQEPGT